MAKHLECGCWLTDGMTKVEGVCDAHKAWQMGMSAHAYTVATDREREACAKVADEHDRARNVVGSGRSIAAAIRARHMEKIEITMDDAKRILEWRALIDPKNEEKHWGDADDVLVSKLLNFVDD